MHPILFRLGPLEIGTYGLLVTLAFFAALRLARRQGRYEGLEPDALTDLSVALLLGGIVGAKTLMIVIDLAKGASPSEVFSLATLRAAGAVHGGIIAAVAVFFWRMRKLQLPLASTMDAMAPALALGQALGRLGCLFAGCCYGSACHEPWAITFTNPEASLLSGTPLHEALHPIQVYTLLFNLGSSLLLVGWRSRRAFPGQLIALYFLLEGAGRAVLETWRGDLDRGVWLGLSWLSTGRLTGLLFMAFGAGLWFYFQRKQKTEVMA